MSLAKKLLEEGGGIYRLAPAWVPRSFCRPAKRIKLHPDDYYVLGLERGGIDERWFASTTHADNGPDTPADEGLSYVVSKDGSERMLLVDAVSELRGELIGEGLLATCICHELDHLDGNLFVDRATKFYTKDELEKDE